MTDNEKLQLWQLGAVFNNIPDYRNDAAACDSLLDTLVEKEYKFILESCNDGERFLLDVFKKGNRFLGANRLSRREAIIAACLEVARKEIEG